MNCLPVQKMWERIEVARQESDSALFFHLLYLGEMLTKLVVAGLVAAVEDDRERHRYRQLYRLVRADSLGEWTQVLDDVLVGPASQYLLPDARENQRELTQKVGDGHWQHEAFSRLHTVLKHIQQDIEEPPAKMGGRQWFHTFVTLRNKTRGHGAPSIALCSKVCPDLEKSVRIVSDNLRLLQRPWAYLHRNLSGKYRVFGLCGDVSCFNYLKTTAAVSLPPSQTLNNGVYVFFDRPIHVQLLVTDINIEDFFFPNGSFNSRTFELISYITDNRIDGDSSPYLRPAGELPPSETEGLGELDVVGEVFSNLPPLPTGYVRRTALEQELHKILCDDRHPIITLLGRGGVGKTSLALGVLHEVARRNRFEIIIWFSARDIDLLPEGPKVVKPRILTERDIAQEFCRLMGSAHEGSTCDEMQCFSEALTYCSMGGPILFVFDNFETVRNPSDLFMWLDTRVRLPNKILITTRHREFKADYPIEVSGMTEHEAQNLISSVSNQLGIERLLSSEYREKLYQAADGHPYIMKILLGEVAKARRQVQIKPIVARRDEILEVLFERTYANLSPVAKRVFLTLCRWRSLIPEIALEAVLLRPANERMDVEQAIEELIQSSFIDVTEDDDANRFFSVPLVAAVFG